ncbi:odorant receptor Or2-like isoform X2 [Plodia interpunctella]|uniref:odorant receptor Or2-like isoform X2 n=1 Tax=Plodia interpunctella TaxID=58824 RepID=UPI0023688C90|nr:odorant receptor Or2-like isoform X2 [Plodia interpunctella]
MIVASIRTSFSRVKHQLSNNSCETLFWLVNFMAKFGGYSFFQKKIGAPFWLLHLGLTFHTYTIGTFMYNKFYAKDVVDYVNSFLNISVLLLISNAGCWTLFKSFQEALSMVKKNDDLVKESERFSSEHASRLRFIKMLVLANFGFHFVNDVLIFSTARIIDVNDIIVSACAGLNPLSGTLNMAVCKAALTLQEFTAIIVVGTYDAALIFLVTHTTAMCDILRLDIASIREISAESSHYRDEVISNRLKNSIYRHSKILQTVKKLQHIYEIFIGVDFSNYAMSLLVFFVLPLDICLKFGPLVSHNLLVFFLYCLLGQRLTTAAERIEIAIYDCGWENFTKKDRITVLFMLKQSQKPVVLFAAKVVPICIYTFAYAMQTIYKFVTVFKV